MAQIVINEISQNYSYNIGTSTYATVAMPITSCWGPGFFDPDKHYGDMECEVPAALMLENTAWQRFPATQEGLEAFVSMYRGPASVYRRAKDFSYQMAMTLLTAGYDVLVCRLCPGAEAEGTFKQGEDGGQLIFKAKYPGTFGNNLQITIRKNVYRDIVTNSPRYYWTIITYVVDSSGVKAAVENISLVFNVENSTDSVPYYTEVESNFWTISLDGEITEDADAAIPVSEDGKTYTMLKGGTDIDDTITDPARYKYVNSGGQALDVYVYVDEGTRLYVAKNTAGKYISIDPMTLQKIGDVDPSKQAAIDAAIADGSASMYGPVDRIEAIILPRYEWAKRYNTTEAGSDPSPYDKYPAFVKDDAVQLTDAQCKLAYYKEWVYTSLVANFVDGSSEAPNIRYEGVFDLLKDKLAYNHNRIIASGWDDQNYMMYTDDIQAIHHYILDGGDCPDTCMLPVSPMHLKIMDAAYYSRCATGFIDIPRIVDRKYVHIEDEFNFNRQGYAQKLARVVPFSQDWDVNGALYTSHSALFVPWGQYTYVSTGKMNDACPSFLALMIMRAQILNQAIQYEWALPTNRKHNLKIGKMAYNVPKKLMDKWQKLDGASVNVITQIPDMGTNLWGNSTLFEVPPATYQALANLSTRFLVNAVEDVAYRCGVGITFQYNNNQAYNKFYAGVTPLLDTMKNVGAIDDYYVRMSADINGLDHVNANTVIGKIWLVINGVVNDIYIDLIALPPGVDLNQFRG